jgi:hypothetical protein
LASLFGVVPKFLLFHHGEHGKVFVVHVTVFCGSWLNLVFLTELTELTKWQDDSGAGCRCAEMLWLFGFATRLLHELHKLVG